MFGTIGKDSLKFYMFHGVCLMAIEALGLIWTTPFDVTYTSVALDANPHTVTLISFMAPFFALCVTVLIYLFNKSSLSDFVVSPVSCIINKLKNK